MDVRVDENCLFSPFERVPLLSPDFLSLDGTTCDKILSKKQNAGYIKERFLFSSDEATIDGFDTETIERSLADGSGYRSAQVCISIM